jgi:hypothetical protein
MSTEQSNPCRISLAADAIPLILLALLTLLAYGGITDHQFLINWDDPAYITANPAVRGFSWENLKTAFTTTYVGNYVPVQIISYMLDYTLWGMNPKGFLIANICYHFSSGVALYVVLLRSGIGRMGAIFGSAVFLVHPVQMESVAWISQRKNLLAMLFFLLAFTTYQRYRDPVAGTARPWHGATVILYLVSVLSKPIAVIFPLVLILYDTLLLPRTDNPPRFLDKTPFFIAAIAVGGMTLTVQSTEWVGGREPYPYNAAITLPLTMLTILTRYMQILAWPSPARLSNVYQVPYQTGLDATVVISLIVGVSLLLCGFFLYRKERKALFWYALFFVGLMPVSQIVPLVTKMNDRYLYFPLLGIAGLTGYAVQRSRHWLPTRGAQRGAVALAGILMLVLALTCHIRGRVWQNSITLFSDAVVKAPETLQSWVGLADGYEAAGNSALARTYYEQGSRFGALSINDAYKLATYYLQQGEYDRANRHYLTLRLKTLEPGGKKEGLLLLGEYQGMIGNYAEAARLVREYLAHYPDSPRGREVLEQIFVLDNATARSGDAQIRRTQRTTGPLP